MLSKYDLKYPNKMFKTSTDRTTLFNIGIDDCAKACNKDLGFSCKSFDFCYLTGQCRLSKTQIDQNTDETLNANECDIYESMNYYAYYAF